jgi:hypothetical protein
MEVVKKGWEKAGLYPLNVHVIMSKCLLWKDIPYDESTRVIEGIENLIKKAQITGICLEEDICNVLKHAFGEEMVSVYYNRGKYANLNEKPINQQRALWLNKEWAVQRRVQIQHEKIAAEKEKAEKRFTKKISNAIHNSIQNDQDKQPVSKPYKVEDYNDYLFCFANSCTKQRTTVALGSDDGWRKCCVDKCEYWFCSSGNCLKQLLTHIKSCLYKKTYRELKPFSR